MFSDKNHRVGKKNGMSVRFLAQWLTINSGTNFGINAPTNTLA